MTEIRKYMNILKESSTDNDTVTVGSILVTGIFGGPLTFEFEKIRNQRSGDGDYGIKVELFRKKKWIEAFVSPLRMMKPGFSQDPNSNKLSGNIWFNLTDKDEAEQLMRDCVRKYLSDKLTEIQTTLDSV